MSADAEGLKKELINKINEAYSSLSDVNTFIASLAKTEEAFFASIYPSTLEIQGLERSILDSYDNAQNKVRTLHTVLESLLKLDKSDTGEQNLPSHEEVQNLLTTFFKGKIKTKSAPLPMHCGCYSYKLKTPAPGSFVCHHSEKGNILMTVLSYKNNVCSVYDPTDIAAGINVIDLQENEWTPLPIVIPEKPISRWEYAKGADVLALWPNEGDELGWTTVFYPAKVCQRPYDQADDGSENFVRGYLLDFGEGSTSIVPEQFVVNYPDAWRPK
ncbi:hypothetical protein TVAG_163370 [Trichomonas vaginalis G3]|uniref:SGF29 C-terminal domain-containing protein n=1 Tax=Trichomonas vaginalis (strain ATCC PRA-98 / G3) TaxID=412133 RepID=A2DG14_TRIV3|nr:SGF29 tudor-like domain family [Trichomonas vaginalis G3]EAY20641.1 hypothetical protein TVAG_163370 [Trichomonas vaginalis G3]KAI5487362.1 SGF29 tudor-like domain family [Trichomonas vaginalis G3]|eukprot:XP_001581627.1 hypothetical protein [Trichomonas vaginalis G3]